jgi:hypothetical protein
MSSIDEIWRQVEAGGPGGALRVDETHPDDLFGAIDATGRRGLVLYCESEPPMPPVLDAVEVTSAVRHDGRWALGIWLRDQTLMPVFTNLCTDLVESLRTTPAPAAPGLMLGRLLRWRELLEAGSGPMSMSALRGLVGELLMLRRCLEIWDPGDVVSGWVGPLGGPQDFVLPGRRIEVKTIIPSARSVHISSIDQLDSDEALSLAVVTLTTLSGGTGIAPAELVAQLESTLMETSAADLTVFRDRLGTIGYVAEPHHAKPMFRLDSIDVFDVEGDFPRLRRSQLALGVERVSYEVLLGACVRHRSSLRR